MLTVPIKKSIAYSQETKSMNNFQYHEKTLLFVSVVINCQNHQVQLHREHYYQCSHLRN